jgi:hypothetical protein
MSLEIVVISTEEDEVIQTNGARLRGKQEVKAALFGRAPAEVVGCALPVQGEPGFHRRADALWKAFRTDSPLKIYLQGHGDWQGQTLGRQPADVWAAAIAAAKPGILRKVSILGCQAGRDRGAAPFDMEAGTQRVRNSVDSFAAQLHERLGKLGIDCRVDARLFDVVIDPDGTKSTGDVEHSLASLNKRPFSKIVFTWQGGRQTRRWAYEAGDAKVVPDERNDDLAAMAARLGPG